MLLSWTFLIVQLVKNLPAMQETGVQFLGWEDPLQKEMAIYSSILAQKIPWTKEPGGLQSTGFARVRHDLAIKPPNHATFYTYLEKYPCILLSSLILLKTTRSNILTVCSSKKILYTIILNFYHHIKTIWSGNDNILYYQRKYTVLEYNVYIWTRNQLT